MGFLRAFISPNAKILVEMTKMNRCDMEVAQAYNGLYFPLANIKRKKGLGRINKIIWGLTNGLLVKSLKLKPSAD